jgi:hypothetical protein
MTIKNIKGIKVSKCDKKVIIKMKREQKKQYKE